MAPPASNAPADLKKHLDDTQAAADRFELRALKEIERRRSLYPTLNKALKAAEENARDENDIKFKDWDEDVQDAFRKQYRSQ